LLISNQVIEYMFGDYKRVFPVLAKWQWRLGAEQGNISDQAL